jgi:hypothetical protein
MGQLDEAIRIAELHSLKRGYICKAGNHIINGDAESNNIKHWIEEATGWYTTSSNKHSGGYAFIASEDGAKMSQNVFMPLRCISGIPATPSDLMDLWWKHSTGAGANLLTLTYTFSNGYTTDGITLSDVTDWDNYHNEDLSDQVTAGNVAATDILTKVSLEATLAAGVFYVDDISLKTCDVSTCAEGILYEAIRVAELHSVGDSQWIEGQWKAGQWGKTRFDELTRELET